VNPHVCAAALALALCGCSTGGNRTSASDIGWTSSRPGYGYYRNVGYVPAVGQYLNLREDGRYDSGTIGNVLGGDDRGSWTFSGGKLLLRSDSLGDSSAQPIIRSDRQDLGSRMDILWRGIYWRQVRPRSSEIMNRKADPKPARVTPRLQRRMTPDSGRT
jgi:hypothetical protein